MLESNFVFIVWLNLYLFILITFYIDLRLRYNYTLEWGLLIYYYGIKTMHLNNYSHSI